MKGYWNKPKKTKEVLGDGWIYTGDIGYMDEDGCVYFVELKKGVIKVSGYQVRPFEVEGVLMEHQAVYEVAVIGFPDPCRGEHPKASLSFGRDTRGRWQRRSLSISAGRG